MDGGFNNTGGGRTQIHKHRIISFAGFLARNRGLCRVWVEDGQCPARLLYLQHYGNEFFWGTEIGFLFVWFTKSTTTIV